MGYYFPFQRKSSLIKGYSPVLGVSSISFHGKAAKVSSIRNSWPKPSLTIPEIARISDRLVNEIRQKVIFLRTITYPGPPMDGWMNTCLISDIICMFLVISVIVSYIYFTERGRHISISKAVHLEYSPLAGSIS